MTIRSRTARESRVLLKRSVTEVRYPEPERVELAMSQHESQMLRAIAQSYLDDGADASTGIAERIQFAGWLVRKL
jgi:hypothetical protein